MVSAIVALAHSMGFGVVAEGIETRQQYEILVRRGCETGQGYLFSPAVAEQVLSCFTAGQALLG